jgi:hypothetical protein
MILRSVRLGRRAHPKTSVADAVALGLVALAFEVFDERLLELEGRVVGPDADLLYTSTSVPSLPP